MKNQLRLVIFCAIIPAIFLGIGCRAVTIEAEKANLLQTDIAFSEASVAKGSREAFHEYLDEEALMLPAGSQPIFGREDIYKIMSSGSNAVLTWEPVMAEVSKSGDLGYTWGRYKSLREGPDGTIKTEYGKYLNVWKKQDDGTWKVRVDIGNSNPMPDDDEGEKCI